METSVRPGFNLDCTFRQHLSTIRFVRYNAKQGYFISCDDKSFKAWSAHKDGSTALMQDCSFPNYQSTFITAMTVSHDPINLVFAACLDGNLRLYSDKLRLRSCMPWSNGAVRDMAFNSRRAEIITAGSYGVKAWTCEMDHEAYRNDKNVDPFAIPRTKDGQIIPWGFGKYQHARQRCQYIVPGARCISSSHKGGESSCVASTDWCERIMMHEATQTLFAMFKGSIFGFDAESGVAKMCFHDLHNMPVTSMIYAPDSDTLMTATLEEGVTVWRIAGGQPHRFRSFGKAVNYVVPDDVCKPTCLLTCSIDGSIALWALDSAQPMYRMKLAAPLGGPPAFFGKNRILLHYNSEVRLFSIQHLAEIWAEYNTAPVQLRSLPGSGGLVLAEYADSSVRLLDAASTEADKSCVTIPPQLSSSALQGAVVSLARARLYALLSSGEVHVWQLARGRPPKFAAAWSHLVRERCCALTLLEAGALPAPGMRRPGSARSAAEASAAAMSQNVVTALHLTLDERNGDPCEHLVLGTSSGDVVVVDADHGGYVTSRFPAFKQQPVFRLQLSLDGEKPLLMAVARCCFKVWSLDEQLRCLHVLDTSQQIRACELLGSQAILGTSSGSVHLVDIHTGQATAAASSLDHLDSVQGCGASACLGHFVTCGRDSQIKVFNARKVLKRSIYLATAPSAICYLNDAGDLLVAVKRKLLVVRASTYEAMVPEDDSSQRGALYPAASLVNRITRPIHPQLLTASHSSTGALPRMSQRPPSGHASSSPAANGAQQTPVPPVSVTTLLPGLPKASAILVPSGPSRSDTMKTDATRCSTTGAQQIQPDRQTSTSGAGADVVAPSTRVSRRQSRSTSHAQREGSTSGAPPSQQGDGDQPLPSRVSYSMEGMAALALDPGAHRTYQVIPGAASRKGIQELGQPQATCARSVSHAGNTSRPGTASRPGSTSGPGTATSRPATATSRPGTAASQPGSRRSSCSGSSYSSSGSGSGSEYSDTASSSGSGSSGSDSSSEQESRDLARQRASVARRAAEEQADLQQRQITFLVENYKLMKLPFQTMYKMDLSAEAIRQQRKRFGLEIMDEPEAATLATTEETAEAGLATKFSHLTTRFSDELTSVASVCGEDVRSVAAGPQTVSAIGWGDRAQSEDPAWQADASGLALRFRKLLPLLSSPSALLEDGTLPPDLAGLLPPVEYTGGKSRKKKKKKAKKKSDSLLTPQQQALAALLGKAAARGSDIRGAGALTSTIGQAAQAMDLLLAQKLPKGLPKDQKKKRKKKGKKKRAPALAVVDPAAYLASVAHGHHHVMVELKAYDKHRMLTHTAGALAKGEQRSSVRRRTATADHTGSKKAPPLASIRDVPSFRTVLKALEHGWTPAAKARHLEAGSEQQALNMLSQIM